MTDWATRLAALRAGQVDHVAVVPWEHKQSLVQTNPELLYQALDPYDRQLWLRNDTGIFTDINVRKALMYALPFETMIQDLWQGESNYHVYPVKPSFGPKFYILYEELSDLAKELFEYHPDKARQLLADAGYPDGFTFDVDSLAPNIDQLAVFADYWLTDLNVTMNFRETEGGTFWAEALNKTGPDALAGGYGASDTFSYFAGFLNPGHVWNFAIISDSYIDAGWVQISASFDLDEQSRIVKDIAVYAIEQAFVIPIPNPSYFQFWQPWMKGYSGERMFGGDEAENGIYENIWIDQELKEEMGF